MTLTCSQTMESTSERGSDNVKVESRASFEARRKEAQVRRRRKKKTDRTLVASSFTDLYTLTGEVLGEGSYGRVSTCVNIYTQLEYAVKIIEKSPGLYNRGKVLKEIEIYHLCRGQPNIIQLIEYFEEDDRFCLVFEKVSGGPLLDHIQARIHFTEAEASQVMMMIVMMVVIMIMIVMMMMMMIMIVVMIIFIMMIVIMIMMMMIMTRWWLTSPAPSSSYTAAASRTGT